MLRRVIPFAVALLLIVIVAVFFIRARLSAAAFGPPLTLCPGPDHYGYVCESAATYAYIDATNDTFLYEVDGTTLIQLPFPFTFYGTTYTELHASVDGNLQFSSNNSAYLNQCLDQGPANGLGDMIAVYWDDLDLRLEGYLETEVVGEAPNRIFVIEWDDVPYYGLEETATFEVQLFEGSNDILFLYADVGQGSAANGRSATIGLQSEAQGLALQLGCNQAVVANASQLRFPHPENANGQVGLTSPIILPTVAEPFQAKASPTAVQLLEHLNIHGPSTFADHHRQWIRQSPPTTAVWQAVDLTADGRDEWVLLRHSTAHYPHLSQLLVFSQTPTGDWQLLFDQPLSTRQQAIYNSQIAYVGDLTADGRDDLLLHAPDTGHLFVLAVPADQPTWWPIAEQCTGGLGVRDETDGRRWIVRDGCSQDGRLALSWDGQAFSPAP